MVASWGDDCRLGVVRRTGTGGSIWRQDGIELRAARTAMAPVPARPAGRRHTRYIVSTDAPSRHTKARVVVCRNRGDGAMIDDRPTLDPRGLHTNHAFAHP